MAWHEEHSAHNDSRWVMLWYSLGSWLLGVRAPPTQRAILARVFHRETAGRRKDTHFSPLCIGRRLIPASLFPFGEEGFAYLLTRTLNDTLSFVLRTYTEYSIHIFAGITLT